jgi:hypothetical protein
MLIKGTSVVAVAAAIAENVLITLDYTNSTDKIIGAIVNTATTFPFGVTIAAAAIGEIVQYKPLEVGGQYEIVNTGGVTAGDLLATAADGAVVTRAGSSEYTISNLQAIEDGATTKAVRCILLAPGVILGA